MTKIYGLLQLIVICTLHNCAISIDSYSPINKFYSFRIFSLLIYAVILLLNYLILIFYLYIHFLLQHYLELYITDTALKISQTLSCFTTSISRGVENYFLRLWDMGISDSIFSLTIGSISPLSCTYVLGLKYILLCEYQAWIFLNYYIPR